MDTRSIILPQNTTCKNRRVLGHFGSNTEVSEHVGSTADVSGTLRQCCRNVLLLKCPVTDGSMLYGIGLGVIADGNFTLTNGDFRPFCSCNLDLDLTTFVYELDWYSWRYTGCANTNDLYVRAFESYRLAHRQTYTTEVIYHAASVNRMSLRPSTSVKQRCL